MKRLAFTLNLIIIFTAIPFLGWFYYVDGVYFNQPVVYRNGYVNEPLELTKKDWKRGETVTYYSSFCKNRDARASIIWALSNDTMTLFPERAGLALGKGCYPQDPNGRVILTIETIPPTAVNGCTHYFTGYIERDIGGGRILKDKVKTEKFCVIDND